jgi:hypothetical protein
VDATLRAAMAAELELLRRTRRAAFAEAGIRLLEMPLPERDDPRPGPWLEGDWASWI